MSIIKNNTDLKIPKIMYAKHLLLSVIAFFAFVGFAQAQTAEDRAKIVEEYAKLNPQSKNARIVAEATLKQEADATKLRVETYLKKHPTLQRTFVKNGSFYFLLKTQ